MQTHAAPQVTRSQRRRRARDDEQHDEDDIEPMHEIIRRWRKMGEPQMTLLALAYKIKCSLTTVSRWEAGKGRLPKLKNIRAMEEVKPGLVRMLFPKAFR